MTIIPCDWPGCQNSNCNFANGQTSGSGSKGGK